MKKHSAQLNKLAKSIKMASIASLVTAAPMALAAPGGSFSLSSDVTSVAAGDVITLDVSFSAIDANVVNVGSFVLTWNSDDFALDASSAGTAGDNDPDQTNFLSFGAEANDDNNRLSLLATGLGFNDAWELSSANGTHTLNLNRQQAFGGASAFSNYGLFQVKLIAKQGISAGTSPIVAKTINIADNQNSNTDGSEYTPDTLNVTLSVPDTESPVVTLTGDATINLPVGATYSELGATVTDNVDSSLTASVSGTVNTSSPGSYTLTYTATDTAGNVGTATRTVNVSDATGPNITLPSNISVNTTVDAPLSASNSEISAYLAGASATDNVDGTVTVTNNAPTTFAIGATTVTFTATDAANNTTTTTGTVTVVLLDVIAPVVTLNGDSTVTLQLGDTYTEAGVTANDNKDGDITNSVTTTGSVNTASAGQYTVTYSATDAAGNIGTVSRTINVNDGQPPVITAPSNITVEATFAGGALATNTAIAAFLNNATATDDGDGTVAVSNNAPSTFAEGATIVTFSASDSAGNTASATATITVTISDTDNDGMPDYFEDANGFDKNDPSDASLDADNDGVSNLGEFTAGTNPIEDETAPVFKDADDNTLTSLPDVTVSSTGATTAITHAVLAKDETDGAITPTVSDAGPYAPGTRTVTWTIVDAAGNSFSLPQTINVIPMADIEASKSTDEGVVANISVSLNGSAAAYPVSIPYTLSGTATEIDDFSELSGTIVIESGTEGTLAITTVGNDDFEGDETVIITLGEPTNAVLGNMTTHTLTIVEENLAPSLTASITQGGNEVTLVDPDGGDVTVTLTLTDLNPFDTHSYDWTDSDFAVYGDTTDPTTQVVVDPLSLVSGIYNIDVTVTDDGNLSGSVTASFNVLEALPELDSETDTDGDGISDADEGIVDTDGDRIPDYLDDNAVTTQLPVSATAGSLQTETGLTLRLGKTAFSAGQSTAKLTEDQVAANTSAGGLSDDSYNYPLGLVDFEITGVQPGSSVSLVIPLEGAIPANAVYRKLLPNNGWYDFEEDSNNSIASAGTVVGACPAPGSSDYTPGLTAGNVCIELTIEDGGANDTDGEANGVVTDPSGVAVVPTPAKKSKSSSSTFDWLTLSMLGLFAGLARLRRRK